MKYTVNLKILKKIRTSFSMPHVAFYLHCQQKSSLTIHATLLYTSLTWQHLSHLFSIPVVFRFVWNPGSSIPIQSSSALYLVALTEESTNYNLQVKCSVMPVFINKVLLNHSFNYTFVSGCFPTVRGELSSYSRDQMAYKAWNICYVAL